MVAAVVILIVELAGDRDDVAGRGAGLHSGSAHRRIRRRAVAGAGASHGDDGGRAQRAVVLPVPHRR